MQIYSIRSLTQPLPKTDRAIALGVFDGVHIGHLAVIAQTKDTGGLTSSILTFNQNAKEKPKESLPLFSKDDKQEFLAKTGVDEILDFDFDCLRSLSPEEFVTKVLRDYLHCKRICCGENTRFGLNGAGDVTVLQTLCEREHIEVVVAKTVYCDDTPVSSTAIRHCLEEGNLPLATRMLGHSYWIHTPIIEGNHLGESLGFPTINQPLDPSILSVKYGVYISSIDIDDSSYLALTNVGIKPTVGSDYPLAETWIPRYTGSLYGKQIKTRLVRFLREEMAFPSLEALKTQIQNDFQTLEKAFTPSKQIKAVFFDFDETLQDRTVAFRRYAQRFVSKYFPTLSKEEQELRVQAMWEQNGNGHAYIGKNPYIPYREYFPKIIALWQWKEAPSIDALIKEVNEMLPSETCLFPGAKEVLQKLRERGFLVGVITNGYSEMQNRKLALSGLRPLLDLTVVSGDEGIHKPDGRLFQRAASRLGVCPEECLYVGDHPYYDMDGAINGHMHPVYFDAFDFHHAPASIPRITNLLDVLTILEKGDYQ